MRFRSTCVLAVLLAGFGNSAVLSKSENPIREARYLMGTVCEITVYPAPNQTNSREAIDAAFKELHRIDHLLSNWKPNSELMRSNAAASAIGNPRPRVKLSNELYDRVDFALHLANLTDGLFDPTVGPLVRAWGFLPSCAQQLPCKEKVSRGRAVTEAGKIGWKKVHLDPMTHELEFSVPGMELDLGGVAKGYAAERAAEILKQHGIAAAMVNLGSSSLKSIGMPPLFAGCPEIDGDRCVFWPVQVSDPRSRHLHAATVFLRGGYAMATSGTYEKRLGQHSEQGSHLIDPYTGQSVKGEISVTVIVLDAEVADALTKPFIIRPANAQEYRQKFARTYPDLRVLTLAAQKNKLVTKAFGLRRVQNFTAATPTYLSAPP